jgi:propionyl-CoA carboxylase alpha chain
VKLSGWAVESRIYAEDPSRNFLPSIGRLVKYRPPQEGSAGGLTIRNDTGVGEGGEISMFYDPMIAKLVTHAPTREAAIDLQAEALDAFHIDGIQHNIPFLTSLMQHPRWRSGKISTGFIKEEFPQGFKPRDAGPEEVDTLAAVAAAIDHLGNVRRRGISQQMSGEEVRFSNRRVVHIGSEERRLDIAGIAGGPFYVTMLQANGERGQTMEIVSRWWPGDPVWSGKVGDAAVSVQVRPILNGAELSWRGIAMKARVYTPTEAALAALMPEKAAADTSKLLLCPMPGLVKAIHVAAGQQIKAGDALAIVEAMKMENILRAERDATVQKINAKAGDSLAVDAVIMEFA